MHLQGLQAQGLRELLEMHLLQIQQGGLHADSRFSVATGGLKRSNRLLLHETFPSGE
jgi:hypothetical protein